MNGKKTFEPVAEHQSLQSLAVERIRDAILEGRLPPGTPLRISTLAGDLGVSPIPVREALQVLAAEGLAVPLPRRGMVVRGLTPTDVANTYDVMGALEGLAARYAAGRLAPEDLHELRGKMDDMRQAIARGDHPALLQMDRQFHSRICNACANRWADEFLRQIWNCTYRIRHVHPRSEGRLHATTVEHQAIVDALEAGDGELSESLVRRHIAGARDDLLQRLKAGEREGGA